MTTVVFRNKWGTRHFGSTKVPARLQVCLKAHLNQYKERQMSARHSLLGSDFHMQMQKKL